MIVEWVVQGLAGLVTALFSVWPWSGGSLVDQAAEVPSSWLPNFSNYLPIALIVTVSLALIALRLGILAYRLILHVYSLVPFV